jgi:hypothetical protein
MSSNISNTKLQVSLLKYKTKINNQFWAAPHFTQEFWDTEKLFFLAMIKPWNLILFYL